MGFWKELAKVAVNITLTVAAGEFIKKQLNKLIKKTIINSIVRQVLFLAAVLVPYISLGVLFGKNVSFFISSVLLVCLLLDSIIRIIPKIYGFLRAFFKYKLFIPFFCFFQGYGPSDILADYLYSTHPFIFGVKAGLDEHLNGWIPSADALVGYVWGYLGKQIVIFILAMAVFLVSFNIIVKPMLLSAIVGVTGLKLYVAPFAMAIDYLFKANTMEWIM
jgi:hypothetical protein